MPETPGAPGTEPSRLREAIEPLVLAHDLALEDLTLTRRGARDHLVVVVDVAQDGADGPDLDTVADLSREVSALLDADGSLLGPGQSELEVTTPGLDRPLREPRHFRRALTRLLRVRTEGGRELIARLLEVRDDGMLVLRPEPEPGSRPTGRRRPQESIELPIDEIATARIEVEFSRSGLGDEAHENEEG